MITAVTMTITTIVSMLLLGAVLGMAASILLILLLAAKEIASTDSKPSLKHLSKALDVGIWPLLVSFALIVALKIVEVLAR